MNSPEVENIDRFFADVVMPKLLECGPALREWSTPVPAWWTRFLDAPSSDQRLIAAGILHEQSRQLSGLALKIDLLALFVVADLIDRELGYRELALIPLSDIGHLTQCAQDVVIGAKHVVEDLDDGLEFGLKDDALERDLGSLKQQSAKRYCRLTPPQTFVEGRRAR